LQESAKHLNTVDGYFYKKTPANKNKVAQGVSSKDALLSKTSRRIRQKKNR